MPTRPEAIAALDELFGAIDKYRTSDGFRELLKFLQRMPTVGPYNGLLLHLQRPGVTAVATLRGWAARGRTVKRDAHPLVTLRAFGPVEFVYDAFDTEGDALPEDLAEPFRVAGRVNADVVRRVTKRAESDRIVVRMANFSRALAGRVSGQMAERSPVCLATGEPAILIIELNAKASREANFATLVHELAHVYCGHLGAPRGSWWPDRATLDRRRQEFEAESVAWIVCSRQGLDPGSYRYLTGFLDRGCALPNASLHQIMVAANHVEALTAASFKAKRVQPGNIGGPPSGLLSINTGEPWDEATEQADEELVDEILAVLEAEAEPRS